MVTAPCRFLAASLRPTPVDVPPTSAGDLRNKLLPQKSDLLAFGRYLLAVFIGAAAAMGWQSGNNLAVQPVTSAAISPDRQPLNAILLDQQPLNAILLDTARRKIDQMTAKIATLEEEVRSRVDRLGATQEQLVTSHEQMRQEITNLHLLLYGSMEQSSRPAPAPVLTPIQPRSPAPSGTDARADWRRQSCCQWPVSSMQ